MRCGESLLPMTEDQLRRIFSEGKPNWLEEHTAKDLSADEVCELLHLPTYFTLLRIPPPSEMEASIDRLVMDRMIDETAGKYSIRRIDIGHSPFHRPGFIFLAFLRLRSSSSRSRGR